MGGKGNFPADRAVAEAAITAYPGIVAIARESRKALARVGRYLVEEAGIRQFLDIGTGLPTENNTHEVAQRIAPESRIVYVDNDPSVSPDGPSGSGNEAIKGPSRPGPRTDTPDTPQKVANPDHGQPRPRHSQNATARPKPARSARGLNVYPRIGFLKRLRWRASTEACQNHSGANATRDGAIEDEATNSTDFGGCMYRKIRLAAICLLAGVASVAFVGVANAQPVSMKVTSASGCYGSGGTASGSWPAGAGKTATLQLEPNVYQGAAFRPIGGPVVVQPNGNYQIDFTIPVDLDKSAFQPNQNQLIRLVLDGTASTEYVMFHLNDCTVSPTSNPTPGGTDTYPTGGPGPRTGGGGMASSSFPVLPAVSVIAGVALIGAGTVTARRRRRPDGA